MEKKHISFALTVFDTTDDLPKQDQELLQQAVDARKRAYAPYSNFAVGAAVLLENGEVVTGNNQENASYPSGLCAERVAIFYAGAQFPDVVVKAIAISASSKDYTVKLPAAPCGNCRQSIAEYEQKQKEPIALLFAGEQGPVFKCNSMADLLPLAFNNSFLGDS
ncbi:MAG: cytidine deaminase [Bacteroidota bacterium]